MTEKSDRYNDRGVSSSKADVHSAIDKLDKGIYPNAFCKILPDHLGGDSDYCNIGHADGAGTKSSLAYAYWKKTGDMSVWDGIAQDAFVMNLDDLLCVGITNEPIVYIQTIDRNKFLISADVLARIINGTENLIQKMNDLGMNIHFAGGETADVPDLSRTIILNGTMTVRARKEKIITPNIKNGAIIVGLSSSGQASYEPEYNSGMGSNGLTSARHDVFNKSVGEEYPETFYAHNKPELIYCGRHNLDGIITVDGHDYHLGKLVLSPTRTYAPVFLDLMKNIYPGEIQAIIHCSGGGQTKVSRFLNDDVMAVKDSLFKNDFFEFIQSESKTEWKEMYKTFNMGHRMEVYCSSEQVALKVIKSANTFDVEAKIIGYCFKRDKNHPQIRIISPHGKFDY